jgi:ribosomal-protein-alanine N-acetyltransferase
MVLRQVNQTDKEAVYTLYSNPEVMKYRGIDLFSSKEEAVQLIVAFNQQYARSEGIRWGLCWKGREEELIGTAGLKQIDWNHFRAEIGYELAPELWNQNLMSEALESITLFCFEELKLHTIEANIAPDNYASARVLRKTGFLKEAHFRENWYYKGWWDSVIYTLHNNLPKAFVQS